MREKWAWYRVATPRCSESGVHDVRSFLTAARRAWAAASSISTRTSRHGFGVLSDTRRNQARSSLCALPRAPSVGGLRQRLLLEHAPVAASVPIAVYGRRLHVARPPLRRLWRSTGT